ncbi:MAG: hypothetical protein EA361_04110 [Bacteroidetes bacterium]|nr:MAG: hypothetical protein EA361_04110 [Bacteroidota bacterium]
MQRDIFRFLSILLLVLTGWNTIQSQSTMLPSGHHWHDFVQRMEIKSGGSASQFHFALQPLERKGMVEFLQEADSAARRLTRTDRFLIRDIVQSNAEWSGAPADTSRRPLLKHFYRTPSDFYRRHNEGLFLVINPVIHFGLGTETDRSLHLYQNTRGLEIRGMINDKIGFYTYMADNQARFPLYVNRKIQQQQGAIPGEGWNIPFGEQGYDYFTARGYIAFQATENIGFQFGQDRNFLGYGQRSLLLSDYGNNYLFLKINTRIWRFHYQNIFARLVDWPLRTYGGRMFDPKYMAAHTLSFNISDRFQLGVFENVVFGRSDTLTPRRFDAHYLNPVIFYRAVEHHIGDPDKVSLGVFWRWIAGHRMAFYGQVYADDFHIGDIKYDIDTMLVYMGLRGERKYDLHASFRHKFGLQKGMHWVDFLGIDNLDLQMEGNWIRPFVYSHYSADGSGLRPASSYSHYSQSLGHPLGANLRELMVSLQYTPHPDWLLKTTLFSARQGMDSAGINMGSNLFRDYVSRVGDYGHTFLQGELRTWSYLQLGASWQWRPNVWFDLQYILRSEEQAGVEIRSGIFMAGLRVNALKRNHWF